MDCHRFYVTCRLALARCGRSGPVQAWCYTPPMSPQQSAQYLVDCCVAVSDIASRQRLRSARRCLLTVPRLDVAHSAVGHSHSPEPLSRTCFETNSETPTVLSLHSDLHSIHPSSTSISVLQRIRRVTITRYINPHFTSLLTYLVQIPLQKYSATGR